MGELDIAGADLSGRGPALLLIGDESFDELADLLKADYMVIRYAAPPAHDALAADDASAVDEALASVETAEVIARRVGWPVVVFPGGRRGYATDAVEFAELLHKLLASESS